MSRADNSGSTGDGNALGESNEQRIARLLAQNLGREHLETRKGPAGIMLTYLSIGTAINLANEIFGFNGWSSQVIRNETVFSNERPGSNNDVKYSVCCSAVVRVTIKDGTFHEDIGYGDSDGLNRLAAAMDIAGKSAISDATKRALRNFGNALGNCCYDKDFLTLIKKMGPHKKTYDLTDLYHTTPLQAGPAPVLAIAGPSKVPSAARVVPPARAQTAHARIPAAAPQTRPAAPLQAPAPVYPVAPVDPHAQAAEVEPFEDFEFDMGACTTQELSTSTTFRDDSGYLEAEMQEVVAKIEATPAVETSVNQFEEKRLAAQQLRQRKQQSPKLPVGQASPPTVQVPAPRPESTILNTVHRLESVGVHAGPPQSHSRPVAPRRTNDATDTPTPVVPLQRASTSGSVETPVRPFSKNGNVGRGAVSAGQLPKINVGSAAGRLPGANAQQSSSTDENGGFGSARGLKRSPDEQQYYRSYQDGEQRQPLGDLPLDAGVEYKRSRPT